MFKSLKFQSYALKENINKELYILYYPKEWIESYQAISYELGKVKKHIPFKELEKFMLGWNSSILYINNFNSTYNDSTWIISLEPIDTKVLFQLFKMTLNIVIQKINNLMKKERFEQWVHTLKHEDIGQFSLNTIYFTDEDGNIASDYIFNTIPRIIYRRLADLPIKTDNGLLSFLDAGDCVVTEPEKLVFNKFNKDYRYSLKLTANIQTTPDTRKPILNIKLSITRWMTEALPLNSWQENDTSVFVKTNSKLQTLKIKKDKTIFWEPILMKMFKEVYIGQALPDPIELVRNPSKYPDFYVTYRAEFGASRMPIGSGESMHDRYLVYEHLQKCIDDICKEILPLTNVKPKIKSFELKKLDMNRSKTRSILANAIGNNELTIEVFYSGQQPIIEQVRSIFERTLGLAEGRLTTRELDITINYHQVDSLLVQLEKSRDAKISHEKRIVEIQQKLPKVNGVTASLIILPYKDEDDKLVFDPTVDPKKAIRAGFATTNRLTQFLSPVPHKDSIHRAKAAVYDLFRQLGYVDDYVAPKFNTINYFTPITALHVINYKSTPYGSTKQALVTVSREKNDSPLLVECPSLWNGKKYYWEACIAFQQVATPEGVGKFKHYSVIKNIKDKLFELNFNSNSNLLLVDTTVTRLIWKFITDGNLSKVKRIGQYTLESIWFDDKNKEDALIINENSGLRIIRIRENNEVPDYLVPAYEEKNEYQSKSGIFKRGEVYYSLASRPNDKQFTLAYKSYSKLNKSGVERYFKFPHLVEIYPIHLKLQDNPDEWVSLAHRYRKGAHQYKETLRLPLFLHLAKLLEEYIY